MIMLPDLLELGLDAAVFGISGKTYAVSIYPFVNLIHRAAFPLQIIQHSWQKKDSRANPEGQLLQIATRSAPNTIWEWSATATNFLCMIGCLR